MSREQVLVVVVGNTKSWEQSCYYCQVILDKVNQEGMTPMSGAEFGHPRFRNECPTAKKCHFGHTGTPNFQACFGLKKVTALVFLFNSEIVGTHF